ncbi:SDR family oxidoreductase [Sabulicella rubraurantiaca]|uniref:SDR family oxidoreductase n=1 Tax=Sabulicella rubraurantiaca TaxID=2811429 RepID=UPI001A95A479|nr:SDR family oxidoreductase [Sabulicella rubraurantiaca]
MDLGISGRTALVCAASKGLGKACALALAREGVQVTIAARGEATLKATAEEISTLTGQPVAVVAADVTTAAGHDAVLAACPNPDILINNAGGPPPGHYQDWRREDWIAALDANMLTPIELIRRTVPGMVQRGFGRIVNITSSAVKDPISVLGLSNGARAGLTGFVAGLARELAPTGVTINNLLPGPFDTDRIRKVVEARAKKEGRPFEEMWQLRMKESPMHRVGAPEEFGAACAFICSSLSGYMTGQNILLDGGAYRGTF